MQESQNSIVAADALANNHQLYIDIYHINSKKRVKFKAFLTAYSEAMNTSYDVQHFVMNQEPVRKLKGIMRQINISWDIPSVSAVEAEKNLSQISLLANMLYPEQVKQDKLFIPKVGGSPVFKMRLVNFVRNATDSRTDAFGRGAGSPATATGYSEAKVGGLTGYIDGLTWEFDMDAGFFLLGGGRSLPKNIRASFTYYPVHEKSPVWLDGEMKGFKGYPYPEGMVAHENSDREATGYSARPSAAATAADIPVEIKEAKEQGLLDKLFG